VLSILGIVDRHTTLIYINVIEEDKADAFAYLEEIAMTSITSLHQSSKCAACGEWLIAPERSTYVSEERVSNFWVCPKCGNKFETSIYLTQEIPLTPEVVDTFFPTLLVA
jgi:uncharacterized protein with PIN domain